MARPGFENVVPNREQLGWPGLSRTAELASFARAYDREGQCEPGEMHRKGGRQCRRQRLDKSGADLFGGKRWTRRQALRGSRPPKRRGPGTSRVEGQLEHAVIRRRRSPDLRLGLSLLPKAPRHTGLHTAEESSGL